MLKRIGSTNKLRLKFLGITIYKRIFNPNEQYFLNKTFVIKREQNIKTIKLFGIKILSKHKKARNNVLQNSLLQNRTSETELTPIIKTTSTKPLWFIPIAPLDNEWDNLKSAKYSETTRCVVILPVYKGLDETLCSVYYALKSRTTDQYSLLVINDAGPDEELNQKLNELAEKNLFDYHVNEVNLGFVKTINYAITYLSHNLDVILLNSDAFVFDGWFEKMIHYAKMDESIATITPMSNNATIASYPLMCEDNNSPLEITPQQLDKLASEINSDLYIEVPTGIGFCFYMRRKVIDEIGLLDDDSFKVGYGEENDFCMRAIHAGYKNIIIGDTYVFHVGSVSFSSIKVKNMRNGEKALTLKHPNYLNLVHNFINADPMIIVRRNLDIARLKQKIGNKETIVILSHAWDGGIDTYLEEVIRNYQSQNIESIFIKVHDKNLFSIYGSENEQFKLNNIKNIPLSADLNCLDLLFKTLSPKLIHINSFAGLDWYHHQKLLNYFANSNLNYHFILHDYGCMSFDFKLLSAEHIYHGIPSLATRNHWCNVKQIPKSYDINVSDAYERRERYNAFFKKCSKIEAPSYRTRDIVLADFPEIRIDVVPHKNTMENLEPATRNSGDKIKIASLGALSVEKGSQLLSTLAIDSKNRNLNLAYYLVGSSNSNDTHVMKTNDVTITGKYSNNDECIEKLREIAPDLIILPSIWEETFSYTLSIALALKIPTIVFNIGAQAERTKDLDWVVKLDPLLINNPCAISELIRNLDIDSLWDKAKTRIN